MTRMTPEQLKEIIAEHQLWRRNEGDRRADLGGADLGGVDLRWVDLSGANLSEANLSEANLYGADLRWADLRWANLREADLYRVNLRGANLRGANLSEANLYGANLREADLGGADLRRADLSGANPSESRGLAWVQVGPIGKGRRTIIGVWIDNTIKLRAGCFHGTITEFQTAIHGEIAQNEWGWSEGTSVEQDAWTAECLAAADHIQQSIHNQLEAST